MYDSEGGRGVGEEILWDLNSYNEVNEKTLRQKPVTEISYFDLKVDLRRVW